MTIAIRRQPRFNKFLVLFGIVAVLAVAALAAMQMGGSDGTATGGYESTRVPTSRTTSMEAQDGYLVPASILAEQAAAAAELDLQSSYLPPLPAQDSAFVVTQDGYLPPEGWSAPVEGEDIPQIGARGPQ